MDVLKARIPTKRETWLLFLGCVLLIQIRAYLVFFKHFPSLVMYMTMGEVLGAFSYIQVFALFESAVYLAGLWLVNFLLPEKFFREKFLPQGMLFLLASYLWIIPLHYQQKLAGVFIENMNLYYLAVTVWLLSLLLVLVGGAVWMRRSVKVEKFFTQLAEWIAPLSVLYLVIDAFCLLVILYRQVFLP